MTLVKDSHGCLVTITELRERRKRKDDAEQAANKAAAARVAICARCTSECMPKTTRMGRCLTCLLSPPPSEAERDAKAALDGAKEKT